MTAARRFHFCERFLETATIASLEHDEHDAVQNEHGRDGDLVIEMLVHEIVERKTEHSCRQASNDDHAPKAPRAATLVDRFARREGVELMEVQNDNGHDGANLDDDQEQRKERIGNLQFHELVNKNHVARRGNRQPFSNTLDQTNEQCF